VAYAWQSSASFQSGKQCLYTDAGTAWVLLFAMNTYNNFQEQLDSTVLWVYTMIKFLQNLFLKGSSYLHVVDQASKGHNVVHALLACLEGEGGGEDGEQAEQALHVVLGQQLPGGYCVSLSSACPIYTVLILSYLFEAGISCDVNSVLRRFT